MNFRDFLKNGEESPETPAIPMDVDQDPSVDETPESDDSSDEDE